MKTMFGKCAVALLLLSAILPASACGQRVEEVVSTAADTISSVGSALGQLLEGDVTGEIGKDYRTQWFSFKSPLAKCCCSQSMSNVFQRV